MQIYSPIRPSWCRSRDIGYACSVATAIIVSSLWERNLSLLNGYHSNLPLFRYYASNVTSHAFQANTFNRDRRLSIGDMYFGLLGLFTINIVIHIYDSNFRGVSPSNSHRWNSIAVSHFVEKVFSLAIETFWNLINFVVTLNIIYSY